MSGTPKFRAEMEWPDEFWTDSETAEWWFRKGYQHGAAMALVAAENRGFDASPLWPWVAQTLGRWRRKNCADRGEPPQPPRPRPRKGGKNIGA